MSPTQRSRTSPTLFVNGQRASRRPQRACLRRRRHALAWAAAVLLATPGAQSQDVFTGNAPVYVGSWFNGSFTEAYEFQLALDWAGWCNAHIGSVCSAPTYWGSAGNWSNNAVPGIGGDAVIGAGHTVRVSNFISNYQGFVGGGPRPASLSSLGRIEVISATLAVGHATFADLHLRQGSNAALDTTGLSTVALLSSGGGIFQGVGGETRINGFTPSAVGGRFEPWVRSGHTLNYGGAQAPASAWVLLEPTARFVNSGQLDMAGGSVLLQGTANFATIPVFVNQGGVSGSGSFGAVQVQNQGQISIGGGEQLNLNNWGAHSGRFIGAVGSVLNFGGQGSAGHSFAAGSQVSSLGTVLFGIGQSRVQGSYNVARTDVMNTARLVFEGGHATLGRLAVDGSGTVELNTSGGGTIDELLLQSEWTRFTADSGAPLALGRLDISAGSLIVRSPVDITQQLRWASGVVSGAGLIDVMGDSTLLAGSRRFLGQIFNQGHLSWEGGDFSEWSGRFEQGKLTQFDIVGDFNSAGGVGGKFVNSGRVSKTQGSGRSTLAMSFDSLGGSVRSLSGTLVLSGGGTHTGASFSAAAGAAIELSGGITFGGTVTASGALHLVGGNFTLLSGTNYAHAAGNRFDVADLRIDPGAQLSVGEPVNASGSVSNRGRFTTSGNVSIGADFDQRSQFTLSPGRSLQVGGSFFNHQDLAVSDASLHTGALVNHARIDVAGSDAFFSTGLLDNRGVLVLGPAGGLNPVQATIGGGINSGSLRVDGGNVVVYASDLHNTGQIWNEGQWQSNGSFTQYAGGSFINHGRLSLNGTTWLQSTASINNSGVLELQDGALAVDAGAQVIGAGQFTQWNGVTHVNGLLQQAGGISIEGGILKGTGTVAGPVMIGAAGQWTPGNSPGTMTVDGDAQLWGGLEIEALSSTLHDRLLVSGSFHAGGGSAIDFVFGPGFQPAEPDFDSLDWLTAASASLDQATLRVTGLPANWSATLAPAGSGGKLNLSYDLAQQIATSGSHLIGTADVHFNAVNTAFMDRLENGGHFHNRTGARLGTRLLINQPGAWVVNRAEIGVIDLDNRGRFDNHSGALLGATTLVNTGQLRNEAGATLSSGELTNRGQIVNRGDMTLQSLDNGAGADFEQRGSLQVFNTARNDGRLVVAGPSTGMLSFYNTGELVIEAGGSIETREHGWFWHSAGSLRVDGVLASSDIRLFGGSVGGNGVLRGPVTTFVDINPGNSIGLLTVDGDLIAGNVNLEIASATDFDRLVVTGNATINSATLYLLGSYRPTLGDSLSFFSVGGALQLSSTNWAILRQVDAQDASMGWTLWANAQFIHDPGVPALWRAQFVNGTLNIVAVPEPGSWALMAGGLFAVLGLARRRLAAQR